MKSIRRIIELNQTAIFSNRQISETTGVSRPIVAAYLKAYAKSGLTFDDVKKTSDDELIIRLTKPKEIHDERHSDLDLFFPYMVKELLRKGVTRELLWREYRQKHHDGFEYSQFCNRFRLWCDSETEVTLNMEHKAGDKIFVDFAGEKRKYLDNGVERDAELFVAVLGASQYTYIEAVRSQRKEDFIPANRNALEFFGGVPAAIMPDCLKSAVSKADKYESVINPDYENFANHYGTVIFPARPHSPKDKALVEGAVKIMYTRILAPIRDRVFESLEGLNEAIQGLLEKHNAKNFQRMPFSRADLFESIDKPVLKLLPERRYELTIFQPPKKVGFNYHVELTEDKHFYSVPYCYAKKEVSVCFTARTIEIYHGNDRIAFHKRATKPGYTTAPEHRPAHHKFYLEWTPERIISWAAEISIHTKSLVSAVLEKAAYPEQAYRSCVGIINLSKKYPAERLDTAARMAISGGTIGYQAIKRILETERDLVVIEDEKKQCHFEFHENVRGQVAYQ